MTEERTTSQYLRELAEWLEVHNISGRDICSVSVDGWGSKQVHVHAGPLVRIMDGKAFTVGPSGQAREMVDDVEVVCVLKDV